MSFVQGLQGRHPRYIKASAGCKHFSVHGGPENIPVSRLSFDAKVRAAGGARDGRRAAPHPCALTPFAPQVLERDWRTTFLPQFQACVRAGSYSFMCSYNRYGACCGARGGAARGGVCPPSGFPVGVFPIRINGVPACANKKLLTDILRGEWGFEGYVVSDEGAVELIMLGHHYTRTFLETAIGEQIGDGQGGPGLLAALTADLPSLRRGSVGERRLQPGAVLRDEEQRLHAHPPGPGRGQHHAGGQREGAGGCCGFQLPRAESGAEVLAPCRRCAPGCGPSSTRGCGWGSLTPQP